MMFSLLPVSAAAVEHEPTIKWGGLTPFNYTLSVQVYYENKGLQWEKTETEKHLWVDVHPASGKEVYKLKEIQRYCKTKIYAQKVPSLNDVANTKMENILDDVERVIEQEDLDMMINAIEERVNNSEFTAMDMAAAFLKICCGMTEDNKNTEENDWEFGDTGAGEDGMVRLFINIGKKQRVRPGDILGAIAGESGMDGKLIGTIDMYDKYTFVEVPREYAREVLNAMKNVKIKGKTVAVEPANQK